MMKNYKNLSDEALDDLFKKSADKDLPDFDETAWDEMESLLDDSATDGGWLSSKKPLIYGGVIVALLSVYFLTKSRFGSDEKVPIASQSVPIESPILNSESVEQNSVKADTERSMETVKVAGNAREFSDSNSRNVEAEVTEKVIRHDLSEDRTSIGDQRKIASKTVEATLGFLQKQDGSKRASLDQTSQVRQAEKAILTRNGSADKVENLAPISEKTNETSEIESEDPVKLAFRLSRADLEKMELRAFKLLDTHFSDPILVTPEKINSIGEKEIFDKWNLRVALSPDFSFVPSNSLFKIGHNWAALLEYRINARWTFQTGAIKSLKYYNANPDQYQWPEVWGDRPEQLNQIDARCNMLDIPVNVRYDFTTGNSRWFAQTGFTSYLMLNEQYDYVYASTYANQVWETWEGKTGFYLAGAANFSFGLEKKVARRLSFQIEPFVKIPMANLGYGKVKLMTTGLFLSTKINLSK